MKNNNVIQDKTFAFAERIVNLYKHLIVKEREYVLSKQLLRSGTSIGANVEEAIGGSSKKDFQNKLSISYKEARETRFWLRLLQSGKFIDSKIYNSFLNDIDEICRILGTIIKTLKSSN
jgi:four helix bundle protein